MRVFSDLHHTALFYSLHLLFEKRLGWELYYPIGEDWLTQGYWKIAEPYQNHPSTIRQFLNPEAIGFDQYKSINGDNYYKDGIYYCYDPIDKYQRKAITFDRFKEMDFDIIISSYQPHDQPYEDLVRKYHPKAKHIAQMGNIYQTTTVKNVMCSTVPYPVPPDVNAVFYHQEFDLNIFKYKPPTNRTKIVDFINMHPSAGTFDVYKNNLPEFEFRSYGASCSDGTITGEQNIADIMADSTFGWQIKPGGDGFGHIIHNWYAVGRPVITNLSDYADKLAGQLLIDGKTCLNLEACGFEENLKRIQYWSLPDNHNEMCLNAYNKFKEVVNFDKEFESIKQFLGRLI